jgi:DNA-binding protein Fis|uniref:DNA binding HTH domain-containing protein n=1 Tax=Desulfomonile tiedjei TaxID=2358 RepID=A0A7C4ATC6_9BACT
MKDKEGSGRPDPSASGASLDHVMEGICEVSIGSSLDRLVEYLLDNGVENIHPLIMGEVERHLIIKALERSRGNKLRAAEKLGISRNTFHRKVQKIQQSLGTEEEEVKA